MQTIVSFNRYEWLRTLKTKALKGQIKNGVWENWVLKFLKGSVTYSQRQSHCGLEYTYCISHNSRFSEQYIK